MQHWWEFLWRPVGAASHLVATGEEKCCAEGGVGESGRRVKGVGMESLWGSGLGLEDGTGMVEQAFSSPTWAWKPYLGLLGCAPAIQHSCWSGWDTTQGKGTNVSFPEETLQLLKSYGVYSMGLAVLLHLHWAISQLHVPISTTVTVTHWWETGWAHIRADSGLCKLP